MTEALTTIVTPAEEASMQHPLDGEAGFFVSQVSEIAHNRCDALDGYAKDSGDGSPEAVLNYAKAQIKQTAVDTLAVIDGAADSEHAGYHLLPRTGVSTDMSDTLNADGNLSAFLAAELFKDL